MIDARAAPTHPPGAEEPNQVPAAGADPLPPPETPDRQGALLWLKRAQAVCGYQETADGA